MRRTVLLVPAVGLLFLFGAELPAGDAVREGVSAELLEGVPDKRAWEMGDAAVTERWTEPGFGLSVVPRKFTRKGQIADRTNPFVMRATGRVTLAAGEYRFLLRSRNAARLLMDGQVLLQTEFLKANASGHEKVPEPRPAADGLAALLPGHQEKSAVVQVGAGAHEFRLEGFVGGQKLRQELGELLAGIAKPGEPFRLLSPAAVIRLDEESWTAYSNQAQARHRAHDLANRRAAGAEEVAYWNRRHELARQEWKDRPASAVPAVGGSDWNAIDRFIGQRLEAKKVAPAPLTDDAAFLRRVTLDTVGVIPNRQEVEAFLEDRTPNRRTRAIERLLADPRWADNWVGYWQDVLAENPGILKPTLNNTGPFRWWIHQAFFDNLPMDRFATELVLMEGSPMGGGTAGFGIATQNDVPMAAKGDIIARAFLGVDLQCARCHDAPFHPFKQKDLFSLAAMLNRGPQVLPITSTVRVVEGARKPRVDVTLQPGTKVEPAWPFAEIATSDLPPGVLRDRGNPRELLAALLTSPRNERFAEVIVNRLWKRYLGWGLVEPVDDWLDPRPSHPELLHYLARELVTHDYDLKYVAKLILTSHTYQRVVLPDGSKAVGPEERRFASPARRRLTAEQLVDSLFQLAGKEFDAEELTMDPEGRRPITEMMNLGRPRRAWEFTSLSNERDRPALSLPNAQNIVDVLTAFGWRDSRQNPTTTRDETPTPVQPLILANGVVGTRITRLSDDSCFTALSLEDRDLPDLIEAVFRNVLSRNPTAAEKQTFMALLKEGYADRRVPGAPLTSKPRRRSTSAVSWSNHLNPEATRIKLEMERAARAGDPPTERLRRDWRERMEDMVWALVNSPEFLFLP